MPACCASATRLVAGECRTALSQGYSAIKLHETTAAPVCGARRRSAPTFR
jgi:hypothetical protein